MSQDAGLESLPLLKPESLVPSVGGWARVGGLLFASICSLGGTFAALGEYRVVVKAPAVVRPAGDVRLVQAASEGKVAQLGVRENQPVRAGALIARLDDTDLRAQLAQNLKNITLYQLQLEQIGRKLAALAIERAAEADLGGYSRASVEAKLALSERGLTRERDRGRVEVRQATVSLQLAEAQLRRHRQVLEAGGISQSQFDEKRQLFEEAHGKLEQAKLALAPSDGEVRSARAQILQEQARSAATQSRLQSNEAVLASEELALQNSLRQAQRELAQARGQLDRTAIRAPVDGIVLRLSLRNPGQVVRLGEAIAQVAPSRVPLLLKAQVNARDIGRVAVGQLVYLRISSYPYTDYGTLKGRVRAVAPDLLQPDTAVGNPQFEVTVVPERPFLLKGGMTYPLRPGMEARADILTARESLLAFGLRKLRLRSGL